jgi:hypothetical protein
MNEHVLEKHYQEYAHNLASWVPEGVVEVDLMLLHNLNLLHYYTGTSSDAGLTRYFQVIETFDKITLINEQFVVWIVPDSAHQNPMTYTLIARQTVSGPHLELVFITRGVYNNSKLVLRVLEKFLEEIQENQAILESLTTT